MRVQYDVMVQEFARVLEKKGFTHEDAENAAIIFAQNSLAGVYSHDPLHVLHSEVQIHDVHPNVQSLPSSSHKLLLHSDQSHLSPGS